MEDDLGRDVPEGDGVVVRPGAEPRRIRHAPAGFVRGKSQTLKQVLRVERRSGGEGSGMPFEVEQFIKAYEAWLELQP